jgi:hypothetical protein
MLKNAAPGLNTKKMRLGKVRLVERRAVARANKADKRWDRFAKYDPETKSVLDDIRSKAKIFQQKRTYDISKFSRDQYKHVLHLKRKKRLKRTLRAINKATLTPARTNRMFGLVKRASIPGWDIRRISYIAGMLDSALEAGIELEDLEEFRKRYARKRSGPKSASDLRREFAVADRRPVAARMRTTKPHQ